MKRRSRFLVACSLGSALALAAGCGQSAGSALAARDASADQEGAAGSGGSPACDTNTTLDTCEGTVAVDCSSDTGLSRRDCAKDPVRKRCFEGSCVATGTECDPKSEASTCSGTSVEICLDGYRKTYDCAALGFSTCSGGVCQ